MKRKLLVIVGPTASGKSTLAVQLATKFKGIVISADSRQVYRGLDIGTGKISKREMRGIPHHLLDVVSPKRTFTAQNFVQQASEKIAKTNALPIVVGGTGFYIDALLGRRPLPDVPPNRQLRARLQKKTTSQLFAMLKKADPKRAKAMNTPSERNNKMRLVRALEIAASKPTRAREKIEYNVFWVGIKPASAELERRIKIRLHARIRAGMITEAKRLHAAGLSYKRMTELGLEYRALARLLQKKITRDEFEAELFRDIRRYAKKQLAYWKRNDEIRWFDPKQKRKIAQHVAEWI